MAPPRSTAPAKMAKATKSEDRQRRRLGRHAVAVTAASTTVDEEEGPLSGNPYFSSIVGTYLKAQHVPVWFQQHLPEKRTLAALSCGGKCWMVSYSGQNLGKVKRFEGGWPYFMRDNELKPGDACVFELIDANAEPLKFRVRILRGEIPTLAARSGTSNSSSHCPIVID